MPNSIVEDGRWHAMTWTLLQGDCLEIMPTLEAGSIDLVITDPPYNISEGRRKFTRKTAKDINLDFGDWDKFTKEEYLEFSRKWLAECYRVLKEKGSIYVFISPQYISHIKDIWKEVGGKDRHTLCWHKTNPVPHFMKTCYLSSIELITYMVKSDSYTFHFGEQKEMHNFYETPACAGLVRTDHPNQKPLNVVGRHIEISTNSGDLILDCFAGSGTTGEAAEKLGRNSILIEKDPHYCNVIKERMSNLQQTIFSMGGATE